MRRVIAGVAGLLVLAGSAAAQTAQLANVQSPTAPAVEERRDIRLDGRALPIANSLNVPQIWQTYKQRFVTNTGRVVDTGNGLISHSEGQGYGMLLAVAANDRATFDRIWGWTRANLMVRDDQLLAWRWTPNGRPAIADMNNATDGDILVAWALAEAAELWADVSYRSSGRRIAVEIGRKVILFKTKQGALVLPGVAGFTAQERGDGPVINISYYVFPAFARLNVVAPEIDWSGLIQTGLDQVKAAQFGPASLPSDWVSLKDGTPRPADGFPPLFSYNAVRIPLYLAWAGVGDWDHYHAFHAWATRRRGSLASIDVNSGRDADRFGENGYASIAALLSCAIDRTPLPADFRTPRDSENYYPATLHLMAIVAANMRYASCLRG